MVNILLAVDGSGESKAAAEFLARLPLRSKPHVTVLTVMENTVVSEIPIVHPEEEEQEVGRNFETVRPILESLGLTVTHAKRRGHPSSTILAVAKEIKADLIVLGAIGHSALYRIALGSTADFVANNAQCSVLVVRPHGQADIESGFRILLAYDGSPYAKFASQQMFDFDWPESTHIDIVMMIARPRLLPEDVVYDQNAISEAENSLPSLGGANKGSYDIRYTVRETQHVGDAILQVSEANNTNFLFVGSAGKSALTRFFLGSTSRHLLHHSRCTVWIARNKQYND